MTLVVMKKEPKVISEARIFYPHFRSQLLTSDAQKRKNPKLFPIFLIGTH